MFPDIAFEPCELGLDELVLPLDDVPVATFIDACGDTQALNDDYILIVSRLCAGERYKGHDQLIDLMPSLVQEFPKLQLVIAGTGDDEERLKNAARERGVGHAVLFTGFVTGPVLARLFSGCRLFAMPSRGEGFGLVYLEAMQFGKPCVASNRDGATDVVVDGHTGFLVDPDRLSDIRNAIARLLRDRELSDRLGNAGRERLNQRFRYSHFRQRF